ncbi:MAG TPA: cbb3-type cytochrome oxidase assembly protein CcoS [Thermodesulfovibrionales bacterium]|nr:cbb3-type cytochrome oxidase assembly protein CcoS [Thermodesulfovibrionales bacterium]
MAGPVLFGFLVSLGMGLAALAFFLWAVLAGQMEDTEDLKYRILQREQDDDANRTWMPDSGSRENTEFHHKTGGGTEL